MTDLRCALRHRDGTARHVDVTVPLEPSAWSADDAKEALWACVRALEVAGIYRISLIEVEPALSWQIEIVTATATLTTPVLSLSSMAYVWLSEAVFELPHVKGLH
jgi:hypothetical protein